MVLEFMGQLQSADDPASAVKSTQDPDLRWLDNLLDTAQTMTTTITSAVSAKAAQEREQEFQLARLRLTMPTQQQVQQAIPWLVIGIPAALILLSLLRRRR